MILKEINYKHPTDYENATHEEIPQEELHEDGEIRFEDLKGKILYHVLEEGDWMVVRKIDK